jgi:hypothetical protein
MKLVVVLVAEVVLELAFSQFINSFIGITWYRYFFIMAKLSQLLSGPPLLQSKEQTVQNNLTTPRLQRALRNALKEPNSSWQNSRNLSLMAAKVVSKLRVRELVLQ